MYVYLYDNFLRQKKFASVVKNIEVRLTDYGIGGKILRLNNFIDNKPIIEDEIKKVLADEPKEVLLDLSRMEYIASAGIRVLLVVTRSVMKSGGKIAFASPHTRVQQIFDMGGFAKVFPLFATKEGALASFR